jgi:ribosomal protein S18 acetylase RimI-like enzyme
VTTDAILLRAGLPDEAEALTEIAHLAKRHWGYPESWIEGWRSLLTITPEYIAQHAVWVATVGSQRAGFAIVSVSGTRAVLEHLWIHPDWMQRGVGRDLFTQAVTTAKSRGCSTMEIESDPNAQGFYAKMGASLIGQRPSRVAAHKRALPILEIAL